MQPRDAHGRFIKKESRYQDVFGEISYPKQSDSPYWFAILVILLGVLSYNIGLHGWF